MTIPDGFDDEFLDWLRAATEGAWARYRERSFLNWVGGLGAVGAEGSHATQWVGSLAEATIEGIERTWSLRFPPDYRRLLRRLHATDRPLTVVRFFDAKGLIPIVEPGFYNWLTDEYAIQSVLDGVFEGLRAAVESSDLWQASWGPRPQAIEDRQRRLRERFVRAAKLIPLFGDRFLVAEPGREGNPVLSISQSDIVVYGSDLREYLLNEFSELLGLEEQPPTFRPEWTAIPFWGDFLREAPTSL